MQDAADAVVIGGGIAGSSLAIQLATLGWKTLLLDRQSFPRHKPCGEFLSPEALEMLVHLGVYDAVKALEPSLISQARLVFRHGGEVSLDLPGNAWGVSRYTLDASLHQAAEQAGAIVLTGVSVVQLTSGDQQEYTVTIKHPGGRTAIKARTVIAAWGSHRRTGLIPYSDSRSSGRHSYIGIKSHVKGVPLSSAVELYFVRGGYVGLSTIEKGIVNVAALLRRDQVHGRGVTMQQILNSACSSNPKLRERLADASHVADSHASIAPVDFSYQPTAWKSIPHVGDAAVMLPPLFGDGMSAALRSSLICSVWANQYLKGEITLFEWEQEYASTMQREFSGLLKRGYFLQTLGHAPFVPRLFSGGMKLFPPFKDLLIRSTRLQEMSPSYDRKK